MAQIEYINPASGTTAVLDSLLISAGPPEVRRELVILGAGVSGGCSTFHLVSAGSTNATNIKASAGQVYGWNIFNLADYPVYVKLHNTAGTPTAGSGVVRTIAVQAGTHMGLALTVGMTFATGIGVTIVKDIADAGATAVLAADCVVDLDWI